MPSLENFMPHPNPQTYNGSIHFPDAYSYLQDAAGDWALLQMDQPFTGVLNFTIAAHTAAMLSQRYVDNDPVTLHGVMISMMYNQQAMQVLFLG